MANRDVKLIIRAKNEASREIDSVSDALKQFVSDTEKAGSSASKADDLLGRLGQEFGKLNSQIAGLKSLDKIAGYMDRVARGVENLKSDFDDMRKTALEVGTALAASAANVGKLTGEYKTLSEAQQSQRADLEAARAAIGRNAAAQKELSAAQKEYQSLLRQRVKRADNDEAIVSARMRLEDAKRAVAGNQQAYDRLKVSLASTSTELRSAGTALKAAEREHASLGNTALDTAAKEERMAAALAKGESEYGGLKEKVTQYAVSLGVASTEQAELTGTLARAVPEADRLAKSLAALQRFSTGGKSFADPKTASALRSQRQEIEKTGEAWKSLEAEARRLASEMRGVAQPTAQQVAAFRDVTSAAKAAKGEYVAQQAALAKLQGSVRSTFAEFAVATAPLDKTNAAIKKNVESVNALSAAMGRYSTGTGGFASADIAAKMREQTNTVDLARQRWLLLTQEVQKLSSVMRAGGGATAQQNAQFRSLSSAANAAEQEFKQAAAALRQLESSSRGGLFAGINRESRQAMSLFQRLRGEVLSLATAYAGLYAVISNVGSVITARQKLEASENRLGAVFGQNGERVRNELAWLEAQAQRLGIQFGELSDQYSKFAVAADAVGFSAKNIRKVFLSVAEAGRVNKLSLEDMNGIFLALQQMISKGKISSEELRQQLGERLPGAIQIMADALGVTSAELMKMMENGEVLANESNMLKFAKELDRRFGSQLASSLRTTTTLIGQFFDNIYQAQLRVGEGGFMESFNRLLQKMNEWFRSREGRDFFLSLGAALGKFTDLIGVAVEHADLFAIAAQAIVAVKVTSWLTSFGNHLLEAGLRAKNLAQSIRTIGPPTQELAGNVGRANVATRAWFTSIDALGARAAAARAQVAALGASTALTGTSLAVAQVKASAAALAFGGLRGVMVGLGAAFRVLSAAVGGWVGVIAAVLTTVGGYLLVDWLTGVDEATAALDRHDELMGKIRSAYEAMPEATRSWSKALQNVSLADLEENARQTSKVLKDAIEDLASEMDNPGFSEVLSSWNAVFGGWSDAQAELRRLTIEFKRGGISLAEYKSELESLHVSMSNDSAKQYIEGLLKSAEAIQTAREKAKEAREELDAKKLSVLGLRGALDPLNEGLDKNSSAFDGAKEAAEAYGKAIDTLKGKIPELAVELKKAKELSEIQAQFGSVGFNNITPEMAQLGNRAIQATLSEADSATFKQIAGNTKVSQQLFADIFREESKRNNAYDDGWGTWTIGYGSTRMDGRPVRPGDTVTDEKAMQMAIADLDKLIAQINAMVKVSLSDGQLRALVSYAYNAGIGSLARDGILAPLNRGDYKGAESAIRNGVTTSKGKDVPGLHTRRKREADLFASGGDDPAVAAQMVQLEERRTEELEKQADATQKRIEDQKFEISQQDLKNVGKEREAAIEAAARQARAENKNIGVEELALIKEQAGALWDKQQLKNAEKEDNQQVKDALKEVNLLEQTRNQLIQQRKALEQQGDGAGVDAVNAKIAETNTKLQEAIDKAIAMQQALGGATADATIGKLEAMKGKIDAVGDGMQRTAMTSQQMSDSIYSTLESGIIGLFDTFAQAIANGEDAMGALGDAFRKFAANFLLQIAQMIIKQTLFNALQGISKAIGGAMFGLFHTGGLVGATRGSQRAVAPAWFNNAVRYHSGGIAGLKPDEVPAVLKQGEEVLTETDPRHRANGGGAGGSRTKIVNMFDAPSFLSEALNSAVGEEALLNFVRANPGSFKAALG